VLLINLILSLRKTRIGLVLTVLIFAAGCYRGQPSKDEPVHLNPNMDTQPKYKPQSRGDLFPDGSAMRKPVEGTVAREWLRQDSRYYSGRDENGEYIEKSPVEITEEGLYRGRERFDIYCSICHGAVGDGNGIMVKKSYIPPPTFHQDRIREMPDGEIFDVISSGIRNMPSYRHQIPVKDRWLIISYLRALQRSQDARLDDIPEELREDIR
jgi:mono/diheme cytochrome c family protein